MRSVAFLAALPLIALAAPAAAQIAPATATDVFDGIEACEAITETEWLHMDRLPAAGWEVAERRAARMGSRRLAGIYEKEGNNALLVIGREERNDKRCVVLARLENTAGYAPLVQGVAELAGMPSRQDGFAYIWDRPGFTLRAEPSGEAKEPNARFTITATGEGVPAATPASAAAASGDTSNSDGVLTALKGCISAIGANGFDGTTLTGAGWTKSSAQLSGGASIDLFETEGSDVMITPGSGDQGGDVCLVRGKVADGGTLRNIRAALTGLYGTPEADGDDLYWLHEGRVFYLMTNYEEGATGPFAVQIPVSYAGETE